MIGRTNASGGGGLDTDDLTAVAGDVLKGKTAGVKGSDDPVTGTLELTGNAADANVLTGKTYYNTDAKTKRNGTMANNGAVSASLNCGQSKSIPAGYTTGGTVTANSLASQTSATAAASHILSGQTAWVNGNRITGNMANRGAYGGVGNSRGNDAGNKRMWVRVPGGYYNENANVYLNWSDIASMAGLTADKIKKGVSIMNVLGSWEGYTTSPFYIVQNNSFTDKLQVQGTSCTLPYAYKSKCDYISEGSNRNESRSWIHLGAQGLSASAASGTIIVRLNQTIDLAPYNYINGSVFLHNQLRTSSTAYIGISKNPNLTSISFNASASRSCPADMNTSVSNLTCNISSITGSYYIYFALSISKATGSSAQYTAYTCSDLYLSTT